MMQQRPTQIRILSAIYFAIACVSPFLSIEPPILQWLMAAAALGAAVSLWKVSKGAFFALPMAIIMVISNLFAGFHELELAPEVSLLFSTGWVIFHLPFLTPKILQMFLHPERQWWRRAERKNLTMPVILTAVGDVKVELETFDISETGVFVPLFERSHIADHLAMQRSIDLAIGGSYQPKVFCCGRVVRRAEARGQYPAGLGIQFLNVPGAEKKKLRQILSSFATTDGDSSPGSLQ